MAIGATVGLPSLARLWRLQPPRTRAPWVVNRPGPWLLGSRAVASGYGCPPHLGYTAPAWVAEGAHRLRASLPHPHPQTLAGIAATESPSWLKPGRCSPGARAGEVVYVMVYVAACKRTTLPCPGAPLGPPSPGGASVQLYPPQGPRPGPRARGGPVPRNPGAPLPIGFIPWRTLF